MVIDCSDVTQFSPLCSNSIMIPTIMESPPTPTLVVGGPSSGDKQKKGKSPLGSIPEEPAYLLKFTEEDVKDELLYWKNSIYGFALGANPPVEVVEGFLKRMWAKFPINKISFCPNGVFLVRFKTSAAKEAILQQGHFLFDNKPLIVRPWNEDVDLVKDEVKEVLVWVRIHNLHLKFWGKCHPRIAGLLGRYVRCDSATTEKTCLGFARVMVDVLFRKPMPEKIFFMDEDDKIVNVKVEFEWQCVLCTQCKGIGHDSTKCRKSKGLVAPKVVPQQGGKKKWVPKQVQPKPATVTVPPQVSPPVEVLTTHVPTKIPNKFQVSWSRNGKYHMVNTPARKLIRLSSQDIVDVGLSSVKFGTHSFLENLYNVTPKVGIGTNGSALSLLVDNFIHLEVTDLGNHYHFWLTMVYAFNGVMDKKPLWDRLCSLKTGISGAWVICGDFNTVLTPVERLGGASTAEEMDYFNACIDECEVGDCPASDSLYTWCNKYEAATRVYSRLDRVLINHQWLNDNSQAYAHFYNARLFDHTPSVVQSKQSFDKKRRSFKYYNMWSQSPAFKPCVQQHWSKEW
ncbi:uncharacterized protein LOC141641578 [Silene latifolia]|uniref:uncharacterized protein LOC141641578 n=1 Tax=Silene latifolia TaxID=37657 RepID=UPI003D77DE3E